MKVKNYNRGYFDRFDCVIHGTIEVDKTEFAKILPIIKKYCYDFDEAITTNYYLDKKGNHFYSFGVSPIDAINNKYHLLKYKRGNYQVKLLK